MPLLLVVEDDGDIRRSVSDLLRAEGHSVSEAANSDAALDLLRTVNPAAVILDYGIPAPRDGDEFLREKARDPKVASIPVIVMSGFMLPPIIDGVVAILRKPFDVEQLLAIVRRVTLADDESTAA